MAGTVRPGDQFRSVLQASDVVFVHGEPHEPGPRMFDLERAAEYCSVSVTTMRRWVQSGIVSEVRIPVSNGQSERIAKVLIDRWELDELITSWRTKRTEVR